MRDRKLHFAGGGHSPSTRKLGLDPPPAFNPETDYQCDNLVGPPAINDRVGRPASEVLTAGERGTADA